ncbi:MAG: nonstructural protein [Microviridae sp.]|nr:MAG: nonstructural protein [Microviridae sp.]
MKVKVFSVLDSKLGSFAQPWFSPNTETGIRAFVEAARDPSTTLGKYPEDFSLYLLGEFDDDTGQFTQSTPTSLGTAASFKRD